MSLPHRRVFWIVWGAVLTVCAREVWDAALPKARPVVASRVAIK